MTFVNSYADETRAAAYATLDFPGTYHLAFRDLPRLFAAHTSGSGALDFGCGAGRSTRFLRGRGFAVIGVDISAEMLRRAHDLDPTGDYRRVGDADLTALGGSRFDLVLSAFTFDNIPTREQKVALFRQLRTLLAERGAIVNVVSTPDIYTHEWASFSTLDFPENWRARPGDVVRTIITDVGDRRPVDDVLWPDAWYREVYEAAGLEVVAHERPLATGDEPIAWVSETTVAPWSLYVLRPGMDDTPRAWWGHALA
ncbi:MAG TPA: class I SAM-dependent methyltransferase [Vicinamibacterales bacterium]